MATKAPTKKPAKKPTSAKASGNGYDADAIQTLEGLEAVRKRPGMYIGGTGSQGLMHLVWELIDNAVDEAAAGHATRIDVTLHRDQTVEVADNGRGIPIDEHAKRKVSALEVVFTELHAGGKFGGGAYGASGGLHGVGASVVNALSSRLIAQVDREGHTWELAFRNRVAGHVDAKTRKFRAGHELHKVKKIAKTKTGTRVRFLPDRELFDADAGIDFDEICDRVTRSCYLVPGLKVRVHDKRTGGRKEPFEFVSRGGLTDLVDSHSEGDRASEVISLSGIETFTERVPVDGKMRDVERECTVQVAMRWVKGFDSSFHSFVNTIPTDQGGTHVTGFERALTRAVNDVLLKDARKLAKLAKANKHRATKDDIQEGLVAAIKIEFPEPQFRGQTKQELGTPQSKGSSMTSSSRGSPTGSVARVPRHTSTQYARRSPRRSSTASPPSRCSRTAARQPAWARPACPTNSPTVGSTAPTPSSSSSRVTRRPAPPRWAATRRTRRSCPYGARW